MFSIVYLHSKAQYTIDIFAHNIACDKKILRFLTKGLYLSTKVSSKQNAIQGMIVFKSFSWLAFVSKLSIHVHTVSF